jgi:hypothetical protein
MQSENINELAAALAKAQGQMKAAAYNKINPHFRNRYADMAAVIDAIRGPLSSNGLSYTQTTQTRDGHFYLLTTLLHSSGQWTAGTYPLPTVARPQELGAALTYARRYSLSSIVGIAPDDIDDDAESANGQTVRAAPTNGKTPQPEPRKNPHLPGGVEENEVRTYRYDENGNRIDWIDTSGIRVETFKGDKAKAIYKTLRAAMLMNKTPEELVAWGEAHAEQVASLGTSQDYFQLTEYQYFLDELRSKQQEAA